jgi:hypothetical protein
MLTMVSTRLREWDIRDRDEKDRRGDQGRFHRRGMEDDAEGRDRRGDARLGQRPRLHRQLRRGRRRGDVPRRAAAGVAEHVAGAKTGVKPGETDAITKIKEALGAAQ